MLNKGTDFPRRGCGKLCSCCTDIPKEASVECDREALSPSVCWESSHLTLSKFLILGWLPSPLRGHPLPACCVWGCLKYLWTNFRIGPPKSEYNGWEHSKNKQFMYYRFLWILWCRFSLFRSKNWTVGFLVDRNCVWPDTLWHVANIQSVLN